MASYDGSCHCGGIKFTFVTALSPSEWSVRACSCSFCQKHRPRYVSDPLGSVQFQLKGLPHYYRFATQTAQFLTCAACGVFVAAVHKNEQRSWCVVNINTFDNEPQGVAAATTMSFTSESPQQRMHRREQRWTPVIESSTKFDFALERIDHLVLTVKDIDATINFYCHVLGMQQVTFGNGRKALSFGQQKINLHQVSRELEPKALNPTSGSADLCLVMTAPIGEVIQHLRNCRVDVAEGPVMRTGALGPIHSIYIRDPDGNLLELSNY